jgi:hypothetical protein
MMRHPDRSGGTPAFAVAVACFVRHPVFVCHSDPERSEGEESPHWLLPLLVLFVILFLFVILTLSVVEGEESPHWLLPLPVSNKHPGNLQPTTFLVNTLDPQKSF